MRELKFRVWDNTHQFIEELSYPWAIINGEVFQIKDGKRWNNVILMQYTGLKDKNGKEIYEGDILEYDGEWIKCHKCGHRQLYYSSHKLYLIKWDKEMCGFDCVNDENSMSSCIWGTDMKIVGNIYENPNLLEEK